MNRNAIKKFATWARTHLREGVTAKAARYGITAKGAETPQFVSGGMTVAGSTYDAPTTALYGQLAHDLNDKRRRGLSDKAVLDALVDEMAYTWFNRLTALRFMEVKGYTLHALSSSTEGLVDPDLLQNATTLISGDEFSGVTLDDLDRWRKGGDETVYRNLLVAQCRELAEPLPFLFGEGKSYTALFLPDNLLTGGSIVRRIVSDIPEEDWGSVEIIGWLYQFYISERKDEVFAAKAAYDARDIPAATQLFTPHWIVRYMLENSLGRLWLESHPESSLRAQMPYYLESEPPQPPLGKGEATAGGIGTLKPEDLSVLDPACGSGHILVYAFDLLFAIYQEAGYPEPSIPALILEHNLHGLDIDERAAQLASFALMMKAREKSRRILRNPPALSVTHTAPTRGWALPEVPELKRDDWQPLLDAFRDADNLGSLISPPQVDEAALAAQIGAFEASGRQEVSGDAPRLRGLLEQTRLLRRQYRAVVANPPYMGNKSLNKELKTFAETNYAPYKHDLFSVSVVRYLKFCEPDGQLGFMTPFVWMFISSYQALREKIIDEHTLSSLVQLEYSGFDGATVPICTYTLRKRHIHNYVGDFVRLSDFRGAANQGPKTLEAAADPNCAWRYRARPEDFEKIPGSPIAYWVSERVLEVFEKGENLSSIATLRKGLSTGQNDQFFRLWHEVGLHQTEFFCADRAASKVSKATWYPINKGGDFRRWYGNQEWLVNWANDGEELFALQPKSVIRSPDRYFKEHASWSKVTSGSFVLRYFPPGFIISDAGSAVFSNSHEVIDVTTGVLNSKVAGPLMADMAPTLNFEIGQVGITPFPPSWQLHASNSKELTERCIALSKTDWDNFETSWDFQTHPLLRIPHPRLTDAFAAWQDTAATAFYELKQLEEENNRYWIDAYGLQDELTPEVPDAQITIRRANMARDVKSLISFAVGCMMGRYSLAQPGLQFAGGSFDPSSFSGDFLPDADGILPITDEAYFDDDIVTRFVDFLRAAYGPEHLEENLSFVADALSRKGGESAVARIRRYFLTEFISDHIQTYKKRPVYWLFTSGKGRAFGALVYLHRYTPDTLSYLRNSYVLPLQSKLGAEIRSTERALEIAGSGSAAKAAQKTLLKLREQVAELLAFHDRLLHKADQRIDIDLDDGVAYNYTLFDGLLYTGADMKLADLMKKSEWKRDLLAGAQTAAQATAEATAEATEVS